MNPRTRAILNARTCPLLPRWMPRQPWVSNTRVHRPEDVVRATRFAKGEKIRCKDGQRKTGQLATVVGYSRDRICVRVVFDGLKTEETWHHDKFEHQSPAAEPPLASAKETLRYALWPHKWSEDWPHDGGWAIHDRRDRSQVGWAREKKQAQELVDGHNAADGQKASQP